MRIIPLESVIDMDAKRIAEIREWVKAERDLYAEFVQEGDTESLSICRARVFFLAMRDISELLEVAEAMRLLDCGHPTACLKYYTKNGKAICLRCEFEKKRMRKK